MGLAGCSTRGLREQVAVDHPLPPLQGVVTRLTLALRSRALREPPDPLVSITPDGIETHRDSLSVGSLPYPGFPDDGFDLPESIDDAPGFVRFATVGRIDPADPLVDPDGTDRDDVSRPKRRYRVPPRVARRLLLGDRIEFSVNPIWSPPKVLSLSALLRRGEIAERPDATASPPTVGISQRVGEWEFTRQYTLPDEGLRGVTDDGPVVFGVSEGDAHPSIPHVVSFDPAPGGGL